MNWISQKSDMSIHLIPAEVLRQSKINNRKKKLNKNFTVQQFLSCFRVFNLEEETRNKSSKLKGLKKTTDGRNR